MRKSIEEIARDYRAAGWRPGRLVAFGGDRVAEVADFPHVVGGWVCVRILGMIGEPASAETLQLVNPSARGKRVNRRKPVLLPERRVVWMHDHDPDKSWLDQWDTEEKYRGNEHLIMSCAYCGQAI